MATSLTGPCRVERASPTAPVPRPPQPTRAMRMVLSSAAWTAGTATPARAEAVATVPVVLRKSRRDAPGFGSLMKSAPWREKGRTVQEGIGVGRSCGRTVPLLHPPRLRWDAGRPIRDRPQARFAVVARGGFLWRYSLV